MKNSFLKTSIDFFDLFILVPSQVKNRLEQEENTWIKKIALFHYTMWPTFTLVFFFVNKNITLNLIIFRGGLAAVLLTLGTLAYFFRKNIKVVKYSLFLSGFVLSLFISWSMTLGNPVESIWILMHATLIMISTSSSVLFSVLWLSTILLATEPFWSNKYSLPYLTANLIALTIIVVFGYIFKKNWIQSKINKFLRDDTVKEAIEHQMEFDNEIKRFISPVLVKRIEEKTTNGQTLVMALDDVLMRKKALVAVMFTDMRNFSTRSIDIDFVEQELVPSSSKIIDRVEDNMGVAKQIGDAVFVYYSMEDPEEGLLRAIKDAVRGCIGEKQRIKTLGRTEPERFFSIAYGPALVGNMASFRHREATVIGSPANLSARLDSLTKKPAFKTLIEDGNKILVSKTAKEILKTFNDKFEFNEVNLENIQLIMKSFPNEKTIYLFTVTEQNINALNEVLKVNNIQTIEMLSFEQENK